MGGARRADRSPAYLMGRTVASSTMGIAVTTNMEGLVALAGAKFGNILLCEKAR
jgi:hypothetical protein